MTTQTRNNRTYTSRHSTEGQLAQGLGWFSIGLGVAEVFATGPFARFIGLDDETKTRATLRTYGVREIASGVGILSRPRPAGWVWSRVAGDILDLASLGSAMTSRRANKKRVAMATTAVLGVTALDVLCGQQLSSDVRGNGSRGALKTVKTIIVNRSPEETYRFWHDFQNLPTFMEHLESVRVIDARRSHWKAKTAAGKTVEWIAEIVDDEPNTRIAWRSIEGADIPNSGSVRFERAPGGRGTLVKVEIEYAPPGGALSAGIAKLFRSDPEQMVQRDLRRFKQVLETGEVVKSDASIYPGMHAAQPPEQNLVARA